VTEKSDDRKGEIIERETVIEEEEDREIKKRKEKTTRRIGRRGKRKRGRERIRKGKED